MTEAAMPDRGSARPARRSNRERTESTRQGLLAAARQLFIEHGYAETATPAIVAAADLTRGALYHHFEDKRDLFRHVLEAEAATVAEAIEAATPAHLPPTDALMAGAIAWLDAMRQPGRTRLLLIDGPAVLGPAEIEALDARNAAGALREGLAQALPRARGSRVSALASLLSAAFDRAARDIESGHDPADVEAALLDLVACVVREPR